MSWAGRVATVSMNNVNSEVGYSGTATTTFNDDRVRRLANRTTGSSSIEMKNMRFGLQLPMISYQFSNTVSLFANDSQLSGSASAYVEIDLGSAGSGAYRIFTSSAGEITVKSFTWLEAIMGSAGDYECNLTINSGNNPNSGASVNTWLVLSTGRFWRWSVSVFGSGLDSLSADATLYIRRSSEIGPFRKFDIDAIAEIGGAPPP